MERETEGAAADPADLAQLRHRLLRLLGHELRNSLNGVIGLAEVAKLSPATARAQQYDALIHESACQLKDLVETMLDLALADPQDGAAAPARVETRPLLAGIVAFHERLASRSGMQLSCSVDERAPAFLRTDRRKLALALHLAIWDATRTAAAGARIGLALEAADGGARFSVEGPGAPAAEGSPGWQRAACEELVRALGGQVEVEAAPGARRASMVIPLGPNG